MSQPEGVQFPGATDAPVDLGLSRDQIAELINAVVFESGILGKVIDQKFAQRLRAGVEEYAKTELPSLLDSHIQKAVAEAMNSEDVKQLIDSKFRAITLYMKTDVIPQAVKQVLQQNDT